MSIYIDGYIRRKSDNKKLFEGNFNRLKQISSFSQPFGNLIDFEYTSDHKFREDDDNYKTSEYIYTISGFEEAINKYKSFLKDYENKLRKLKEFEISRDYFTLDEDSKQNYYEELKSTEDSIEFYEERIDTLRFYYNILLFFNNDCDEVRNEDYVELVLWYS